MLIRFTVENYLSFHQRTEFNTIAFDEGSNLHHVVRHHLPQVRNLLRTSVIYGANASGKSNLIKAMAFAKNFIVEGIEKHKNIKVRPFKLNPDCMQKSSRFEFEFCSAEKAYAYGFVVEKTRILEEWLFDISSDKEISVFERREKLIGFNYAHAFFDNISGEDKQRLEFEAQGTRDNLLFLTNCQERNIIRFNIIYKWFREMLIIIFPDSKNQPLVLLGKINEDFFNQILSFFDFNIKRIHIEQINLDQNKEIPNEIKEKIKADFPYGQDKTQFISLSDFNYVIQEDNHGDLKVSEMMAVKQDSSGQEIFFKLSEESDGTRRIIDLIPMLMALYKNDAVVVIDEAERSLHALLTRKLFDLFLNNEHFQGTKSQLIASTHEVTLLNLKKYFRKDEIWFVEKDETGQSVLYSLAGSDVDKLDLVKGYFSGRFGAIPFIADVHELGWRE